MAQLPNYGLVPFQEVGAGITTVFGTLVPPGSKVTFVRSTGPQDQDPPQIAAALQLTLDAGLKQCRSGMRDYVFVLPGHTENVTTATFLSSLVAGTQIIGIGDPKASNAPKFTWTNTAGSWAISVANVGIFRLRLLCDAANGITTAFNVTGSGVTLAGNYISWAAGAALKSTIGITVGSGATDFAFRGNYVTGTATHNVTDGIKVLGATVPSNLVIEDNVMMASATAANGLINVTVAALNCLIRRNVIANTMTSSTACINIGNVAASGIISENYVSTLNDGTVTDQGIVQGAGSLFRAFQNFSCDEPKKSGTLTPAAGT